MTLMTFVLRVNKSVSLVAQSCLTLCDPMDHSTPGLPVHHQLPEFTQTHVHWVGDTIQPSHPLSSPSLPAFNLFQHHRVQLSQILGLLLMYEPWWDQCGPKLPFLGMKSKKGIITAQTILVEASSPSPWSLPGPNSGSSVLATLSTTLMWLTSI